LVATWATSGTFAQTGSIQFVPSLPGGRAFSVAYSATPDGAYVVGYSGSPQGAEAYRWNRQTNELLALGTLGNLDYFRSKAYGISDDGTIVVGRSNTGDHARPLPRAFMWTLQIGITALPEASTNHQFGPQGDAAAAISGDGSVIVGRFESSATGPTGISGPPFRGTRRRS
jgi:probable HAF family extracellular repeat protein